LALASLALVAGAQAQGYRGGGGGGGHTAHAGGSGGHFHGGYRGGYRGGFRGAPHWAYARGGFWPYWGLGIGLGGYYYYGAPGYIVDDAPVVYGNPQPVPAYAPPQPVIYPRNGQDAAQVDADSNACSEWAGKQPNASVDASVFQRAINACMDARGYTVR
jgi:hypothetical protein